VSRRRGVVVATVASFGGGGRGGVTGTPCQVCAARVFLLRAKAYGAASLDVGLPIGGVTQELHPVALCSLGENPVLLDKRRQRH
jgi:hypothetical protein